MRRLNASWLKDSPWMRYSTAKDALYSTYCTVFGKRESKAKTFNLCFPVTDWSDLSHLVKGHHLEDSPHHDCVGQGQAFLDVTSLKSKSIAFSLSSLRDETVAKNRHILSKIIDVIVLCGNQNLCDKSPFLAIIADETKDKAT